jgi:hypothetical protein
MSETPRRRDWPEPDDRLIKQSKSLLYSTLGTGLAGMLCMALFMGYMAREGFGILEEAGASDNLQVLTGALGGGILGFIGGAFIGGVAGTLAALLERGSASQDGHRLPQA